MDEQLKQRLVGATVLVLLGVIFIPMILDGPEQPPEQGVSLTLPDPDDGVSTHTIRLGEPEAPVQAEAEVETGSSPPTPDESADEAPDTPEPIVQVEVDELDPLSAWAVQVYSLADQDRAEAEATRLRDAGFPAFVTRHDVDGRALYRVRVGPEQSREQAERLAQRISNELDLQPAVVRHP